MHNRKRKKRAANTTEEEEEEEGKHKRERERERPSYLVGVPEHLQVSCWQQPLEPMPFRRLATFKKLQLPYCLNDKPFHPHSII
jgi:hypothetical protein